MSDVRGRIRAFIVSEFRVPDDDPQFTDEANLFENGYVDSMGLVELIAFIESTFHVKLSEGILFSEKFTNIDGMGEAVAELIRREVRGSAPAVSISEGVDRVLDRLGGRFRVTEAGAGDLTAALDVHQSVWGGERNALEARFRHRFFENPSLSFGSGLRVCWDGDRIIACLGMLHCDIAVHGRIYPAIWTIDFSVLPEYRGLGVAALLARDLHQKSAVVLYGNLNDQARGLAERIGAKELLSAPVLQRWVRPGDLIHRSPLAGFSSSTAEELDARFDGLWDAAQQEFPIAIVRRPGVLRWRYRESARLTYTFHTLTRGSQLQAYAVTTNVPMGGPVKKAVLVDCLHRPLALETKRHFLASVLEHVARQGAVRVDTLACASSLRSALCELGFSEKGESSPFLIAFNETAAAVDGLTRTEDWHLTFGDTDFYL
jgi:acyl carrier protein